MMDAPSKVDQLATAIKVQDARATLTKVTPIKGGAYQDGININAVRQDVAAGLGNAYDDTGSMVGVLPRNKKGDGVLAIGGGDARVALEMTDSARTGAGPTTSTRPSRTVARPSE